MDESVYKGIGKRIRQARENLGMSQEGLAGRMGYSSAATISHFETGLRKISVADLHRLAETLGLPMSYFIEDPVAEMQRFRLRAQRVRPAAREAVAQFLAFAQNHGEKTPEVPPGLNNLRAGTAANRILSAVGIKEPPVSPGDVAQKLGVPVFYWDFPSEVSGIFAIESGAACIGVNQNHPHVRQRFTIAHELGHLIFHGDEDLFVDFTEMEMATLAYDDEAQRKKQGRLETKANQFAADLLMPMKWVRNDFREYSADDLTTLARRYKVSEQALWFRLINLKLVSEKPEGQSG